MIHEPNTTVWNKGDIVIHDCDSKEPKMLQRVVGYVGGGLIKTQYVDKSRSRKIWVNELKYFHNPEQFNLQPEWGHYKQSLFNKVQCSWENVRIWNRNYQSGQLIKTTSADGGFTAHTRGQAYLDKAGQAFIWLEGHGNWSLDFVEAIKPKQIKENINE